MDMLNEKDFNGTKRSYKNSAHACVDRVAQVWINGHYCIQSKTTQTSMNAQAQETTQYSLTRNQTPT